MAETATADITPTPTAPDGLSFRGDPALKASLIAKAKRHREQDRFMRRTYFDDREMPDGIPWKGCAVGCLVAEEVTEEQLVEIRSGTRSWHEAWTEVTGCPRWLARVEDKIFENLPEQTAYDWPVRLLTAIPVGADLGAAREAWLRDVVLDPERGMFAMAAAALESASHPVAAATLRAVPFTAEWRTAHAAATEAHHAALGAQGWAAAGAVDRAGAAAAAAGAGAGIDATAAALEYAADVAPTDELDTVWTWIADRLVHHLAAVGVVPSIPEVSHVPSSHTEDGIGGPTWVFLYPNGLGARVVEIYEGQYDVAVITKPDLDPQLALKAQRQATGLSGEVSGSLALQERLSAIESLPRPRTHVEDALAAHVALGDALDAVAEVVSDDTPIMSWGGYGGGSTLDISVGAYLPTVDHRPVLHDMAVRLGIEGGWKPKRGTSGRWEYRYEGTWQGRRLVLSCDELRRPDPEEPRPLPAPLPADDVAAAS